MGCWRMKRAIQASALLLVIAATAHAEDFRHIGDFIVKSRLKIARDQAFPVAIKPLRLSVYTDGISVRVSSEGEVGQASEYRIYRSDGIGRQTSEGGAIEVVPGVQATSERAGVFRQLRLTRDTLTITTFPGISDQTIVTHAVLAKPPQALPVTDDTSAER